ncbi:hypothetical protein G9A89_005512 [Geosiphon pyriformis]|nr:hypothetical protein G9A89_005512 [Geosiphon pyriformis]
MYKLQTLVLIRALLALKITEGQNSPSTISTIPSSQNWYTCSKSPNNTIYYNVTLLEGKPQTTNDIGKIDPGYPILALPGAIPGFITFVANKTETKKYLNPNFTSNLTYKLNSSCYQIMSIVPVKACSKNKDFIGQLAILCLVITNPMNQPITFGLDLEFNHLSSINIKPNIPTTQLSSKSSTSTSAPNTPTQTAFSVKILVIDLVLIVASFLISYFAVYAL